MSYRTESIPCLILKVALLHCLCSITIFPQDKEPKEIKKLVLKGARIEGEMGAIKALIVTSEKRPDFSPMALKLAQKDIEIRSINKNIVDKNYFKEPFPVELPE